MKFIRISIISFIIFLLIISYACQRYVPEPVGEAEQSSKKLRVVTTITPLHCFTENIAGDLADVENLLPSGAGPHGYSFSPADINKISKAQVLIKNGVNLELWLDKLIASSGKKELVVIDTSAGVEIINNDPHIWLSPENAIVQVQNIRDAIINADPGNSDVYSGNAAAYVIRLKDLDREIKDEIKTWRKKEFITFHSAFRYFARDYGLEQAAVIQETPEIEPSPRHIASVMEIIKSKGINSIFTEPQISHKIVRSIADDLNLQVYSLDTLETGSSGKEWYEERMRANLAVLRKALK